MSPWSHQSPVGGGLIKSGLGLLRTDTHESQEDHKLRVAHRWARLSLPAAPAQGSVGAFCDGDGPSGPSRPALVAATMMHTILAGILAGV